MVPAGSAIGAYLETLKWSAGRKDPRGEGQGACSRMGQRILLAGFTRRHPEIKRCDQEKENRNHAKPDELLRPREELDEAGKRDVPRNDLRRDILDQLRDVGVVRPCFWASHKG